MEDNFDTNKLKKVKKKKIAKTPLEKRRARRKVLNTLMGIVIFCGLLGCLSGFNIIRVILSKTDVELDIEDLGNTESSLIYDDVGNQIALVGEESRISYSYNKLPQVVIDAFVSIEDSRFFEHSGFDLPRFAKAFLENIRTLSFSQGGSTITMQVIKNTYFAVDTIAEKSIDRKVQEIYYSLKINDIVSKEKIIELYINKVNFGANARGIQIASQYYFDKDCTELSLVEAAMLAGIVNSPNTNNPYYHLDNCTKRTHDVLYQMNYHGYITDQEYELAKKVPIENLLCGTKTTQYGHGETISNQAYIDVVLSELSDVYNINPYVTPVKVYTAMNQTVQNYCDELSRGNVIEFQDDYINTSVVLIQNYTGLIVGLCGGRDYNATRLFNYAYDNKVNPGSTSKGFFTYPLAFEYGGLGTNTYITDEPMNWAGSKIQIKEDHGYAGEVSAQRAFTSSYNVCAVKLFRKVSQVAGIDVMKAYLRSIGVDQNAYENINEQYAIGEQNFLMSPIQIAAAESVILSQGVYVQPHTITKIEFINSTKEPIIADFTSTQVLSEGAAWLTSYLQQVSVNGNSTAIDWIPNGRLTPIKHNNFVVYGKTGTSLYDKTVIRKYKLPTGATKDWLMIGGTNDYSFSFWMGYDTGQFIDNTTYVNSATKAKRTDGIIVSGLLDAAYEAFGAPKKSNNRPSTVTSITHIVGLTPFTIAPAYTDPNYVATSLLLYNFAALNTYESTNTIDSISSFTASYDTQHKSFACTWAPYPNPNALVVAPVELEMPWKNSVYVGVRAFDRTWIDGVVQYQLEVINNETQEKTYYAVSTDTALIPFENNSDHTVTYTLHGYYAYSRVGINSNMISISVDVPPSSSLVVTPEEPEIPDTPDTPETPDAPETPEAPV